MNLNDYPSIQDEWTLKNIEYKYYLFNFRSGKLYKTTRDLFFLLKNCNGLSSYKELFQKVDKN